MLQRLFAVMTGLVWAGVVCAQTGVAGRVRDVESGEVLIGATVVVEGAAAGTATDFDGSFVLELEPGAYSLVVTYVGYQRLVVPDVVVTVGELASVDVLLRTEQVLREVRVTADIAIDRKTPVAFSNIPTKRLQEELGTRDLPMIMNSTPGVYATQDGGGDGDARVTIRGFNQRNVAVMLDGIPVNDMENGQVYWSNWFGLDLVTQSMQIQRGLGASKLSIPSVGGTINILTKGIESKRNVSFQQDVGINNTLRSTLGITTGRLKGGWAISVAASYRESQGWVPGTASQGYFYYLRVDKQLGKHLLTVNGFGAPQRHGQRTARQQMHIYDTEYASRHTDSTFVAVPGVNNFGIQYNDSWGWLSRTQINGTDTIRPEATRFNVRLNYYHKPQYSLRHSWEVSPKVFLSNVAYLSVGNGGGTGLVNSSVPKDSTGQFRLQDVYDGNFYYPTFANADGRSTNIVRASVNNHFWYGLLSTLRYDISRSLSFSGGVDARYYRGEHYRQVHDLLGGNYYRPQGFLLRNARNDEAQARLGVGDRFDYDYNGYVRWGGAFGLLEYSKNRVSGFVNVSGALISYKAVDFMWQKRLRLDGLDTLVSFANPVLYNGTLYTVDDPSAASLAQAAANGWVVDSTSAQNQTVGWLNLPNFTFKAGGSYAVDRHHSVFVNAGYLSKATRFNNVIWRRYNNTRRVGRLGVFANYLNEQVTAIEAGHSYRSSSFSSNLNAYFTNWLNKPLDFAPIRTNPETGEDELINVNGLAARHAGVELDFAWRIDKKLTFEGLASFGDWIWNSRAVFYGQDSGDTTVFDPRGVYVGDAAQVQLGGMLRYEPIKGFVLFVAYDVFRQNYANFSPEDLTEDSQNARRQSWRLPNYAVSDFNMGYTTMIKKVRVTLRLNVFNALDTRYVSDATNGNGFNAETALVYFGLGRRWGTTLRFDF